MAAKKSNEKWKMKVVNLKWSGLRILHLFKTQELSNYVFNNCMQSPSNMNMGSFVVN